MSAYTDTIRRWAADDRRVGRLADADGTGEVGLGDGEAGRRLAVRFTLRVRADHVETARYQVFGCGFTIAACAIAAELAEGQQLETVAAITRAAIDDALGGLPPERDYCAALAVEALHAAVKSTGKKHRPVAATIAPHNDHAPRVNAADPVYRLLIDSPAPAGAPPEDRHLFACLVAVAAGETGDIAGALGLSTGALVGLLDRYFPGVATGTLAWESTSAATPADPEILQLLDDYLPLGNNGWTPAPSLWLARSLAARAARPGHLWIAMGLFSRPELTAAIRRHLPALAAANSEGMRWKRFLFKQLCERNGGVMCKSPICGECSDYTLCFEGESDEANSTLSGRESVVTASICRPIMPNT
jgi:nitrogen fixation protein NifQ